MKTIQVIHASTGKNKELAEQMATLVEESELKANLVDLVSLELPLYSSVAEGAGVPEIIKDQKEKLIAADAHIYIAPEYNGGIPPVLTNYIAWLSRSGGDWREAFNGKKTLIASHSGSGGFHILFALRSQLSYVGANVLGRQIICNSSKAFNSESFKTCLEQLV